MAEELLELRNEVVPENESFADMVRRLNDIEFEALLVYMRISGRDQSMIDLIASVRKLETKQEMWLQSNEDKNVKIQLTGRVQE